ncbi:MAG: hypothetical protein IH611_12735 [Deltaproteobacteria bacterium]|nr:hypothetical protein [Deltaproteobacteria bacterium]
MALFGTVVRRNRKGRTEHEISHVGPGADQGDKIAERHDAAYAEKGVP